jgi:hypothetical protein
MLPSRIWQKIGSSDSSLPALHALFIILLHTLTNGQYGFHRDELATLDDARFLDWGYVVYPPLTPFIARLSLTLFGPSLIALRFFSALPPAVAMVLTGLMAGELGGKLKRYRLRTPDACAGRPGGRSQSAAFLLLRQSCLLLRWGRAGGTSPTSSTTISTRKSGGQR